MCISSETSVNGGLSNSSDSRGNTNDWNETKAETVLLSGTSQNGELGTAL